MTIQISLNNSQLDYLQQLAGKIKIKHSFLFAHEMSLDMN